MKGISPVIASILLVLVVISLASVFLVFSGRLTEESTEAAEEEATRATQLATSTFTIESIKDQTVRIRNTGGRDIEQNSLEVRVDGELAEYTQGALIEPEGSGVLTITDLWRFGPGEHMLRVSGASHYSSKKIRIGPNVGVLLDLRFDEGSGTNAYDKSGNDNDGTLHNGTAWVEGIVDGGLGFDGVNDYVMVQNSSTFKAKNTTTVVAWTETDNTTGVHVVLFETRGANNVNLVRSSGSSVECGFLVGTGTAVIATAASAISTGVPTHVLCTYDSSEVKVYVNGEQKGSTAETRPLASGDGPLYIGSEQGTGLFFDGIIDEVRVYDRVYAPQELYIMTEL